MADDTGADDLARAFHAAYDTDRTHIDAAKASVAAAREALAIAQSDSTAAPSDRA